MDEIIRKLEWQCKIMQTDIDALEQDKQHYCDNPLAEDDYQNLGVVIGNLAAIKRIKGRLECLIADYQPS